MRDVSKGVLRRVQRRGGFRGARRAPEGMGNARVPPADGGVRVRAMPAVRHVAADAEREARGGGAGGVTERRGSDTAQSIVKSDVNVSRRPIRSPLASFVSLTRLGHQVYSGQPLSHIADTPGSFLSLPPRTFYGPTSSRSRARTATSPDHPASPLASTFARSTGSHSRGEFTDGTVSALPAMSTSKFERHLSAV